MFHMNSIALWTICSLVAGSQAYWVDPVSCKSPQVNTAKVVAAIDEAFDMAGNAFFGLDDVLNNSKDKKANIQDLAGWMFGTNDNGKWAKAQNFLQIGGSPLFQKVDNKDQIRVYCDLKRLTATKDEDGKIVTQDSENNYRMLNDAVKVCDQSTATKAWTGGRGTEFSVIQICPWYLSFNNAAKYTGLKGFLMNIGNKIDKGTQFIEGLAPIDGFSMLAQTMLHEITHTAASGGSADVAGPVNSYTWDNCRKLSTQATSVTNAESLAYFGLGVQMINAGYTLTQDGKFSKAGGSKRSIDDLMERVWVA